MLPPVPAPRATGKTMFSETTPFPCATDGERIARHDRLRDAICEAASSAALAPQRERRDLFPNSTERPADIFLKSWVQGKDAALDVTVISPLQEAQLRHEADRAGAALDAAKKRKMDHYYALCREVGVEFVPLAVETLGGWEADAILHLRAIARHMGRRSDAKRHLFQRLAVRLQRAGAGTGLGFWG